MQNTLVKCVCGGGGGEVNLKVEFYLILKVEFYLILSLSAQ